MHSLVLVPVKLPRSEAEGTIEGNFLSLSACCSTFTTVSTRFIFWHFLDWSLTGQTSGQRPTLPAKPGLEPGLIFRRYCRPSGPIGGFAMQGSAIDFGHSSLSPGVRFSNAVAFGNLDEGILGGFPCQNPQYFGVTHRRTQGCYHLSRLLGEPVPLPSQHPSPHPRDIWSCSTQVSKESLFTKPGVYCGVGWFSARETSQKIITNNWEKKNTLFETSLKGNFC